MASSRHLVLVAMLGVAMFATTITASAVRSTDMQNVISEESQRCDSGEDSLACIKVRAMRFVDTIMNKDNYKISDVEVRSNGLQADRRARAYGDADVLDKIENYIQGHDITMDLPIADAKVTVSSRNLATDGFSLNLKFNDEAGDGVVEGKGKKGNIFKKGKKHRLRKMAMPLMALILLKAITVIPMAIGILKIKALNALFLGFFSFIVSVGLAIFHLCKKLAAEHHTAHITAHGPWDGRSMDAATIIEQYQPVETAQVLAYKAYA